MHMVENKERLKYAINTGIKWPIAKPFPPSSGLADGRFKTQNPALQSGILDPPLGNAAGAKAQSRGCLSAARLKPGPDTGRFGVRRGAAAFTGQGWPDPDPKVESRRGTHSPSPPRRRGPGLDSHLRGNDGRYYFHAFAARLKPGPVTRLRPCSDTRQRPRPDPKRVAGQGKGAPKGRHQRWRTQV